MREEAFVRFAQQRIRGVGLEVWGFWAFGGLEEMMGNKERFLSSTFCPFYVGVSL